MKTQIIIILLFILTSCSNKKSEFVFYNSSTLMTEYDTSQIKTFDNIRMDSWVSCPQAYVYDYILLRADSLVTGKLYCTLPYRIPADGKFHKDAIDGNQVYLKFRMVNP